MKNLIKVVLLTALLGAAIRADAQIVTVNPALGLRSASGAMTCTAAGVCTLASGLTLVTPNIGVATGTSLALNGATLGANVLAVAGQFSATTGLVGAASKSGAVAFAVAGRASLAADGTTFAVAVAFSGTRAAADHSFYLGATDSATPDLIFTNAGAGGAVEVGRITTVGGMTLAGLTTASGTPNSICQNNATKEITVNAALTCTVSSLDFKHDFEALNDPAFPAVMAMRPGTFFYNDSARQRIGFASEYMADLDRRLADGFDAQGKPRSIDQNAILALTVKALQEALVRIEQLEHRLP